MKWLKYRVLIMLLLVLLSMSAIAPAERASAQDISDLFSLSINAGYDGYFRPNEWFPVRVNIENNGDPINGRLVIRPETSGSGLPNTFSTPVDIPTGAQQVITLYITAYANARDIRVEILDDSGSVVVDQDTVLRSVATRDRLYVVLSQSAGGSIINLSAVETGGDDAVQADWTINDLPDRAAALGAVNAIMINDIDTGTISAAQRDALETWVRSGGHLIVGGGASWQATAAGLGSLLPFSPDNTDTINDLNALVRFGGDYNNTFDQQFVIATGEVTEDGTALISNGDNVPLLVRRDYGNGTIDYLTIDPNAQPLRDWQNLPGLWLTMLTSVDVQPSWTHGFANWELARDAVEILPGLDLLPSILTLLAFLLGYVALVGPANYLILQRINRLDWAWITIPIFIVIFTVVARGIGLTLRGNQATLSRISVVQTWNDSDNAQIDQVVGLLAPRRSNYSLDVTDERLLRPIPELGLSAGVLTERTSSNVEISQTGTFQAVDFPLDSGFIAGFNTTGTVARPQISGTASVSINTDQDVYSIQGAIRNNSDITLTNAVIVTNEGIVRLPDAIEPDEVETFSANGVSYDRINTPAPTPLEYDSGEISNVILSQGFFRSSAQAYSVEADNTAIDILGQANYSESGIQIDLDEDSFTQENQRRQAFLNAFVLDQYASTARGDRVYLIAWADNAPIDEVVDGAGWEALDTTLYIIELTLESREVLNESSDLDDLSHVTQNQFTWVSRNRNGVDDVGPYSINMFNDSEVIFRFTPLPSAVLSDVEAMNLVIERPNALTAALQVQLWNWENEAWDDVEFDREMIVPIDSFEDYLGPLNAVEVRLARPQAGGSVSIRQLGIEQFGQY